MPHSLGSVVMMAWVFGRAKRKSNHFIENFEDIVRPGTLHITSSHTGTPSHASLSHCDFLFLRAHLAIHLSRLQGLCIASSQDHISLLLSPNVDKWALSDTTVFTGPYKYHQTLSSGSKCGSLLRSLGRGTGWRSIRRVIKDVT